MCTTFVGRTAVASSRPRKRHLRRLEPKPEKVAQRQRQYFMHEAPHPEH